jgi:hypothetical protein
LNRKVRSTEEKYLRLEQLYSQALERANKKDRDLPSRTETKKKEAFAFQVENPAILEKAPSNNVVQFKPARVQVAPVYNSPERVSAPFEAIPQDNSSPIETPIMVTEEKGSDAYLAWKDHIRECMEDAPKENADGNLPQVEKRAKTVRFAESPKNKPTLLKRKNVVPETVTLGSPNTNR